MGVAKMPTIANSLLPIPKSWVEFEDICRDSFGERWANPNLVKHGRAGQAQQGVDIYGWDSRKDLVAIQCKNTTGIITPAIINAETSNAENFTPSIKTLYIATTCSPDSHIQKDVRAISRARLKQGKFGVEIVFWNEIVQDLSKNVSLAIKHYPQFFDRSWLESHQRLYAPPQVSLLDQNGNPTQRLCLPFQRVRISNSKSLPDFTERRGWLMRKFDGAPNLNYWRELAAYESVRLNSAWLRLEILNASNKYLTECVVHITVSSPQGRPLPANVGMPNEPLRYGKNEKWHQAWAEFISEQMNPTKSSLKRELPTHSLRSGERSGLSYGVLLYFGDHEYLRIKYKVLAKELSEPAEGILIAIMDNASDDWDFERLKTHASQDALARTPRAVTKAL